MVLRLKIMLAFAATAVMAVVVSFALAAMVPATLLAALLAMIVAGALAAGFGYVFGGATAQALSRSQQCHPALHQMGYGRHRAACGPRRRGGRHRQGAEGLPERRHQVEREPQERAGQPGAGAACLATTHRGVDPSVPRLDRRHSRRLRRKRADDGRDGALAVDAGERHQRAGGRGRVRLRRGLGQRADRGRHRRGAGRIGRRDRHARLHREPHRQPGDRERPHRQSQGRGPCHRRAADRRRGRA